MSGYKGLTERETEVLGSIAFGNGLPTARPSTLRKLESKGLIVRVADRVVGHDPLGPIAIPQYEMPVSEHIAFCEWCGEDENG